MLEIILLVLLCKKNAEIVKERGRKPLVFVLNTVGLWVGMKFFGAFIGAFFGAFLVYILFYFFNIKQAKPTCLQGIYSIFV